MVVGCDNGSVIVGCHSGGLIVVAGSLTVSGGGDFMVK